MFRLRVCCKILKRLFNLVMAIALVWRNQSTDFQCVLNTWVLHAENIVFNTPNINKNFKSSPPEVFLRELKICRKYTGVHPCDFNKVAKQLRHGCSPVNLLHIFRTPFPMNTSGGMLLELKSSSIHRHHENKIYSYNTYCLINLW